MSSWQELPDWSNPEAYSFLIGAKPEIWAWEFLRRNPDYKEDWQFVESFKNEHGDNWIEEDWKIFRGNTSPEKTLIELLADEEITYRPRIDEHLAGKWGLQELCNPIHPFEKNVVFKPLTDFPYLVLVADQFDGLLEWFEEDGSSWQQVSMDYAVIAVDLTKPIEDQFLTLEASVRKLRNDRLKNGRLQKPEGHSAKPGKWIRHLQALDARRSTPIATYADIARELGGIKSKDADVNSLKIEGDKFLNAARNVMKNYRKILLFKGTP